MPSRFLRKSRCSVALLEVNDLCRSFGGLRAVDQVSFTVPNGMIKGIIGPNGAGKTTLFNLIAGSLVAESGTIFFDGRPVSGLPPHRIAARGIARTYQNVKIFRQMTVLENVMVGCHQRSRGGFLAGMLRLPFTVREERRVRARSLELLEMLGLPEVADQDASALAFGRQRSVELARALALEPRLILLDEPAAGLNIRETVQLAQTVRSIRDLGITVLIVEHDMSLIMDISDEIVVLDFGRKIAEGTAQQVRRDPEVIRVYLGDEDAEG